MFTAFEHGNIEIEVDVMMPRSFIFRDDIEDLGRGLESGEEFPVVWTVKHPKVKILGNALGHDERAHDLGPYQTILKNSFDWAKEK